jgi:WD40 repeat protein
MAQEAKYDDKLFGTDQDRRGEYLFGKGKIIYYKPSKGYPNAKEAKEKPKSELQLEHIYGFNGGALANKYYRYKQHLICKDGNLIYFMAAAGIVHNIESGTQRHFLNHNDDVTTICVDPRPGSTLVCTGQKDPKDRPGQGKDLPKLWIWDYKTMKDVVLIDNVCTGLIRRVQWSPVTGYLYVICSEEQQLKVYDGSGLAPGKKPTKQIQTPLLDYPTTRQIVHGVVVNPKPPSDAVDELLLFCDGYIYLMKITGQKNKLEGQRLRSVTTKTKEKAFICGAYLPNGSWVVGGASGTLYFGQDNKVNKELKGVHGKPITALSVNARGDTIYTASPDETVKALDENGKEKFQSKALRVEGSDFRAHPAAMDLDESCGALFIGTKTNQIAKFDLKTQKTSVVIDGHDGQIWGVVCHVNDRAFITAGWDKAIKTWNPETFQCTGTYEFTDKDAPQSDQKTPEKWQLQHCALSSDGKWIAVGTTTSTIAVLSYPKLKLEATLFIPLANVKNELEGIEDLQWSPDNKYLAAAHGDGHCYVIAVTSGSNDKITLKAWKGLTHRAAPSHCQWSADGNMLKCLTRDYEVAHWWLDFTKKTAEFLTRIPDPDKVKWHNDPLVAGWDVQGLYQKGWDGTDLNDCAVTSDNTLIASGDDFGTVRLHNYPAVDTEACNAYNGHAEFVVGVDFLADDSRLISVGGADMSIFQWKVAKK